MRKHHQQENEEVLWNILSDRWYNAYDLEEVLTVFLLWTCGRLLTPPATKPPYCDSACLKAEYFCIYHLSTSPGCPHQASCKSIFTSRQDVHTVFEIQANIKSSVFDVIIYIIMWIIIVILCGNLVPHLWLKQFLETDCSVGLNETVICVTANKNDKVLVP